MSTEKLNDGENILHRLHEALRGKGLLGDDGKWKVSEIARSTGYSPGQISLTLNGKTRVNDRFRKAICSAYKINEEWITAARGDMFRAAAVADPQAPYFSPEEERVLELMRDDPGAYQMLKEYFSLPRSKRLDHQKLIRQDFEDASARLAEKESGG